MLYKSFKVSADLNIEEVFETLKTQGNLGVEPYTYKGSIGDAVVYIPGAGDNDIQISVRKGKMTVADAARPKDVLKNIGRDIALDALTNGWSKLISRGNNKKLFEEVLKVCKDLFA